MQDEDPRTRLRIALHRGEDEALLLMLQERPWPDHCLQMIGDGLNNALTRRGEDAHDLARECAAQLRDRGWEGDRELAATLESRLGTEPAPLLRPLRVDLESLSMALEGDPVHGGGRIDLRTGEVWPQPAVEYAKETGEFDEEDEDNTNRWLWFGSAGSHDGYRDMELFIEGLDDPDKADRLDIAITGRGAFRRFKDVLMRWPDLLEQWYAFSNDRQLGRARAWLAMEGYAALPPHPVDG